MALSIGVKKGSKIKIGVSEQVLLVTEVLPDNRLRLTFAGSEHVISDQERTTIAPDVHLSTGKADPRPSTHYRRIAFEAPRAIRIERVQDEK
jgi:fructose-specific component phosphotransferase system IIB-like protein